MTQRDIPVQPNESDEVRALRRLAGLAGWVVTSTTGDGHTRPGSLHYAAATNGTGRAVDLADRRGPSTSSPWLLAINEGVIQLLPMSMIAELIYGGPGGLCVKNGKRVDGRAVYGADQMAKHRNHVHLGVIPGFRFDVAPEVPVPNDPNLPDIDGPVKFAFFTDPATGVCIGYYQFSEETGELHGHGPGAPYLGRSEVPNQ